jgi:hypothetical protein
VAGGAVAGLVYVQQARHGPAIKKNKEGIMTENSALCFLRPKLALIWPVYLV